MKRMFYKTEDLFEKSRLLLKGAIITNKGRHRIPNPLDHNGMKAIEVKWVSLTVRV